jgi:hypothetical protein
MPSVTVIKQSNPIWARAKGVAGVKNISENGGLVYGGIVGHNCLLDIFFSSLHIVSV